MCTDLFLLEVLHESHILQLLLLSLHVLLSLDLLQQSADKTIASCVHMSYSTAEKNIPPHVKQFCPKYLPPDKLLDVLSLNTKLSLAHSFSFCSRLKKNLCAVCRRLHF